MDADDLYDSVEQAMSPLADMVRDPAGSQAAVETIGILVGTLAGYLSPAPRKNEAVQAAANALQDDMISAGSRQEALLIFQAALTHVAQLAPTLRKWSA